MHFNQNATACRQLCCTERSAERGWCPHPLPGRDLSRRLRFALTVMIAGSIPVYSLVAAADIYARYWINKDPSTSTTIATYLIVSAGLSCVAHSSVVILVLRPHIRGSVIKTLRGVVLSMDRRGGRKNVLEACDHSRILNRPGFSARPCPRCEYTVSPLCTKCPECGVELVWRLGTRLSAIQRLTGIAILSTILLATAMYFTTWYRWELAYVVNNLPVCDVQTIASYLVSVAASSILVCAASVRILAHYKHRRLLCCVGVFAVVGMSDSAAWLVENI